MDNLYPPLELTFPEDVSGIVTGVHVQLGQKVAAGDLIATLEDKRRAKAVDEAHLALEKAQKELAAAEKRAAEAYEQELDDTQWELEVAQHALRVAEMSPPTTAVAKAQAALNSARAREAKAAAAYKESLDRPWEPQSVRDGLYETWQDEITARQLAELDLEDAKTALQIHYVEIEMDKAKVQRAKANLASLERTVDPAYVEAVSQAQEALTDAEQDAGPIRLYAPHDGLVVEIRVVPGVTVDPNVPVALLDNLGNLYFVTSSLGEREAGLLRPGQRARITLRFEPEAAIWGEVEAILPETNPGSTTHITAYIRLTDIAAAGDLLPRMTGRAEILLNSR